MVSRLLERITLSPAAPDEHGGEGAEATPGGEEHRNGPPSSFRVLRQNQSSYILDKRVAFLGPRLGNDAQVLSKVEAGSLISTGGGS